MNSLRTPNVFQQSEYFSSASAVGGVLNVARSSVDLLDLAGIYFAMEQLSGGKGEIKFMIAGTGWAAAEVCSYLYRCAFGTHRMVFRRFTWVLLSFLMSGSCWCNQCIICHQNYRASCIQAF